MSFGPAQGISVSAISGGTANRVAIFDANAKLTTDAELAYNASSNTLSGMSSVTLASGGFLETSSGSFTLRVPAGQTIGFGHVGSTRWQMNANGHVITADDNSYDIGASGATRPRTGYFGTSVGIIGTVSGTGTLALGNGTAPTAQADTVHVYSTDDAAGHTIPSFFCEGTNVIATGQADSASSVRVKMRINGTVVTLLAI